FDARLATRFRQTHAHVAAGEAFGWRVTPEGRLAEVIVLDQFSRQLYRGQGKAFAWDCMALTLAQELVARGDDSRLTQAQRGFAYLPYMHSESPVIHTEAMRLFTDLGDENQLKYEVAHAELIEKFGRYPMRNKALGRASTPEEDAYIASRDNGMF
ncbi:MAG: DUF924 domain-containing protein, partial [Magnetospirillum sp.]|nr:DUF924 domain-containing protein [Magnetospirillum sp.]